MMDLVKQVRRMRHSLLFFCSLLVLHQMASAISTDSLLTVWNDAARPLDQRIDAIEAYTKQRHGRTDPDSVLICARLMYEMARADGSRIAIGRSHMLRAMGYLTKGESDPPIPYLDSAITIFQEEGEKRLLIAALNNIGNAHSNKGDFARAIAGLTRALQVAEDIQDSSMTARILGNIGAMYHMQDDLDNAMDYYERRLVIAEALDQKDILSEVLGNMAVIHETREAFDEALAFHARALDLAHEIGYNGMVTSSLQNMGNIHLKLGNTAKALELHLQEISIADSTDDLAMGSMGRSAAADVYLALGDLDLALAFGKESQDLAERTGDMNIRRDAALVLYKVEKALGNTAAALKLHEKYISLRDSIKSEENATAMMTQKFQYDFDKKEAILTAEQEKKDAVAAEALRHKNLQRNAFIGGFGLMVLLAGTFFFQRNRISKEKARSEELLLNILPEEVAEELKEKGEAQAVQLDQVTVLFTDFKGFTSLSENLTPRELVRDLNECFSAFDKITEKYGIEKIKTIGDAYMAAGGLPVANATHAVDTIKAALEMRDFIEEGKQRKIAAGKPYFEIRIGVHTGPVVAGIVGVKKFQYDIWGDTVNTASRMESSGEVGKVNISAATYALVREQAGHLFEFTSRGMVQAKGKGELGMYFVHLRHA